MLTQDSRPERKDIVYFKYVVDPRWSSVSGLTLFLTASDMDPACEASLTVCSSYGRSALS